jgi:hypothetical protein
LPVKYSDGLPVGDSVEIIVGGLVGNEVRLSERYILGGCVGMEVGLSDDDQLGGNVVGVPAGVLVGLFDGSGVSARVG